MPDLYATARAPWTEPNFSANLHRWFDAVHDRPGTIRTYAAAEPYASGQGVTEQGRKILFGQTAGKTP